MRWTILAVPVFCLLLAGCQDTEARQQNQRLQEQIQALQSQPARNDDMVALLLANRGGGDADSDKRFNSLSEDVRAGLADIRNQIAEDRKKSADQFADLDTRLRRMGDMEASLTGLRTMIEAMDAKVKTADPQEALTHYKELLRVEAELNALKASSASAEATIQRLQTELAAAKQETDATKAELQGLQGEDISRHPMYRDLRTKLVEAEAERDRARSDFDNMKREHDALVEQLRRGANPPPKEGAVELPLDTYEFTGEVGSVSKSDARPEAQSLLIVSIKTGRVPPMDTELLVLDARNQRICAVRVVRHYHVADDDDLPVDEIGCRTIDEVSTRPVAKGDRVVWIKPRDSADPKPQGSAGGD